VVVETPVSEEGSHQGLADGAVRDAQASALMQLRLRRQSPGSSLASSLQAFLAPATALPKVEVVPVLP